jgi:hypothetical protein
MISKYKLEFNFNKLIKQVEFVSWLLYYMLMKWIKETQNMHIDINFSNWY